MNTLHNILPYANGRSLFVGGNFRKLQPFTTSRNKQVCSFVLCTAYELAVVLVWFVLFG